MLIKKISLTIVFYLCLGVCWGEKPTVYQQIRVLEAELSLAKGRDCYLIVDIGAKRIYLKAKGVVLREWEIRKVRKWGIPLPLEPVSLKKKTALFPPKREKIRPHEAKSESGTFELEALEVTDMPKSFTLTLDRNISLYIRPHTEGLFSRIKGISHLVKWYVWCPLRTVFLSLKKDSFHALDLVLTSELEAQSFYWVLPEGTEIAFFSLDNDTQ
jgi:hypothetical protein